MSLLTRYMEKRRSRKNAEAEVLLGRCEKVLEDMLAAEPLQRSITVAWRESKISQSAIGHMLPMLNVHTANVNVQEIQIPVSGDEKRFIDAGIISLPPPDKSEPPQGKIQVMEVTLHHDGEGDRALPRIESLLDELFHSTSLWKDIKEKTTLSYSTGGQQLVPLSLLENSLGFCIERKGEAKIHPFVESEVKVNYPLTFRIPEDIHLTATPDIRKCLNEMLEECRTRRQHLKEENAIGRGE